MKNKLQEAKANVTWLRGSNFDADAEIKRLQYNLDEVMAGGRLGLLEVVSRSVYLKPLLVLLGLEFLVQFTGITGITLYMTDIFIKAGLEESKSLFYSAAVATSQVCKKT